MPEIEPQFAFPVDQRMVTNIIATSLNNEAKAIAFLCLTDEFQSCRDISDAGNTIQGDQPVWPYSQQRIKDYIGPFINTEAIAVEGFRGNRRALRLSDLGKKLARPLGGHLLLLSSEIDQSLFEIFGAAGTTSDQGVRAAENRLKIMRGLAEEKTMRITELNRKQRIGGVSATGQITDQMHKARLIGKEESRTEQPHTLWTTNSPGEPIEIEERFSEYRRDVITVINSLILQNPDRTFSSTDIARAMPASYGFHEEPKKVLARVAGIVHDLTITVIKRFEPDTSRHHQFISVNDQQASLFSKVIKIVDAAMEGSSSFIKEGELALTAVLNDRQIVRYLVEKGYTHSRIKKVEQAKVLGDIILNIISASEMPISTREIAEKLSINGINVHGDTVRAYIGKYIKSKAVTVDKASGSRLKRYIIASEDSTE